MRLKLLVLATLVVASATAAFSASEKEVVTLMTTAWSSIWHEHCKDDQKLVGTFEYIPTKERNVRSNGKSYIKFKYKYSGQCVPVDEPKVSSLTN